MKKLISLMTLLSLFVVTGCSNNETEDSTGGDDNTNIDQDGGNNSGDSTETPDINALVVYFSATGNTEEVANFIGDYLNASIYELEPVDPYTSEDLNYSSSTSRVSIEHNDPDRYVELVTTDFDGFSDADYIFLGAPVWWGELSWVIDDFVLSNDFTGKTIIPFATASSSNFDVDDLRPLSEEATRLEGRRFTHSQINEETVREWIDSLNLA